jgi:hypothetical protein
MMVGGQDMFVQANNVGPSSVAAKPAKLAKNGGGPEKQATHLDLSMSAGWQAAGWATCRSFQG